MRVDAGEVRVNKALGLTWPFLLMSLLLSQALGDSAEIQLRKSLLEWDPSWDEQAVREMAEDIVRLAKQRTDGLSQAQVDDIILGLRDLPNVRPVTERIHPLEKEVISQYTQYWVDNYLALGPGDQEQAKQLAQQFDPVFRTCTTDLRNKYPSHDSTISKAVNNAWEQIERRIANPLRREYKKPIDDQVLTAMRERWTKRLTELPGEFSTSDDPKLSAHRIQATLTVAILDTMGAAGPYTQLERLPKPKELVDAENELLSHSSEIDAWRSKKLDDIFARRVRAIEVEQMRRSLGVDTESLLAYVKDIEVGSVPSPTETGETRESNGSDANEGQEIAAPSSVRDEAEKTLDEDKAPIACVDAHPRNASGTWIAGAALLVLAGYPVLRLAGILKGRRRAS